jgi:hypothetical protein
VLQITLQFLQSADGKTMAAASQEGIIYVHNIETMQLKYTIEGK